MIERNALTAGLALLRQPVLPLVGIIQFIYLTGDFAGVDEVISQLPDEIETGRARYLNPAALLTGYVDLLHPLEELKTGATPRELVTDVEGCGVDPMTATGALVAQRILTRELEEINSLLCAPCGCTLCCVGPEAGMAQRFFEIPLAGDETAPFAVDRIDTTHSRGTLSGDEPCLRVDGRDFYDRPDPALFRWRSGWSLILPTSSSCPHLERSGRCRIYPDRPQVCRRPQIFPYMVEPVESEAPPSFRLRQTLLAVVDCPYVRVLQDEIAAYAAACEMEMIFRHNKA